MKFFHISDLHIGKRVNGFSMMEDQKYILKQIVDLAQEHKPDGIWIAGDLYDKSMPPAEAVELADEFLFQLCNLRIPVWIISGNHDSAERVAYGGRMMERSGIFVSRVYDGKLQQYIVKKLKDNRIQVFGDDRLLFEKESGTKKEEAICEQQIAITLMPFLRPAQVRRYFPERTIDSTQQAVEAILEETPIDSSSKNVLIMHQFITGSAVCDSEELSIGGSDQIDVSVLDDFDYIALGHLHGPQKAGREGVRYCGSPLKYSFSEANHKKSVTVVELGDSQKETEITLIPLKPRLDLREIRGPIEQLLKPEVYLSANPEDYVHITLTDSEEILDAIGKLREVYPNIMRLDFEARMTETGEMQDIALDDKTPMELFGEFFELQTGQMLTKKQSKIVNGLFEKLGLAGDVE